jgi:8-oxo-dGTP pyrophosphatase MutT (NUDIX family)
MDIDVSPTTTHGTRIELRAFRPVRRKQQELREEALQRLEGEGGSFLARDAGSEHLTASCFVLSADFRSVLLALHKKAGVWLQLGGHVEAADSSAAATGLREAVEEGGIAEISLLSPRPVDIDRHSLVGSFGACETHWDLGYLGVAAPGATPMISDESVDVAWWALSDLINTQPHLADRIIHVIAENRELLSAH